MLTIFKDKEYKRKFLNLMIPIAIQEAIVILASTISVLMLGAADSNAMSGVSIANNVFIIFNSVISGLIVGGNLLCAQYFGHKDIDKVNQTFNLSIKVALIISIIFVIISETIPSQLIEIFAPNQPEIIDCGTRYLRLFAISFAFRAISGMYFYILKNINKVKQITIITALTLIINVSLCAILIYACRLNEIAAAIAIIVARAVECLLAIYCVKKANIVKFSVKDFLHSDSFVFNKFFRHLIPLLLCKIAWSLGSIMIAVFLGKLGKDIIDANALWSIARNVVISIPCGAGSAAAILLGQELGANKLKEAKEHGNELLKFTLIIGIIDASVYLAICGLCYLIGTELDAGAKQYLIWMSLIYAPSFIFQAFNGVLLDGHYSSGGDTIFVSLSNSLPYWVVVVPLGFLSTSLNWHPLVIFFLITSEEIVKNLPIVLRYRKYIWVRNITGENK